jgi:hypothetical protein
MSAETKLTPELIRHKARIKLFNAVYKQRPLQPVLDHYIAHEDDIVPTSTRNYAERVGRCPGAEVRTEAITLYERDKQIALKFRDRVVINGKKVGLPGLIRREQKAMKHT